MTREEELELKARLFDLLAPLDSPEPVRLINGYVVSQRNVDEFENVFGKLEEVRKSNVEIAKNTEKSTVEIAGLLPEHVEKTNVSPVVEIAGLLPEHVEKTNVSPVVEIAGLLPPHVEKTVALENEKGVPVTYNADGSYRYSKYDANNQSKPVEYGQLNVLHEETMNAVKKYFEQLEKEEMISILEAILKKIKNAENEEKNEEKNEDFFRTIFETSYYKPNIFQRVLIGSHRAATTLTKKVSEKMDSIGEGIGKLRDIVQSIHGIISPRYALYKSIENITDAQVQRIPTIDFDSLYEAERVSIQNSISDKKDIDDDKLDEKTEKALRRYGTSKPGEEDVVTYKRITRDPKNVTVFVDLDGVSDKFVEEMGLSPYKVEESDGTFTCRVMMNVKRSVFNVAKALEKENIYIKEAEGGKIARGK